MPLIPLRPLLETVDKYHYEWTYHSKGDLIPIELKDEDTAEPPVIHEENNDTSNE